MTDRVRRPSAQTIAVLEALAGALSGGEGWLYGLEVAAATQLKSGSLYPILARLAERGLLESRWLEPSSPGRPPRHAYRITGSGRAALRQARAPSPLSQLKGSPA